MPTSQMVVAAGSSGSSCRACPSARTLGLLATRLGPPEGRLSSSCGAEGGARVAGRVGVAGDLHGIDEHASEAEWDLLRKLVTVHGHLEAVAEVNVDHLPTRAWGQAGLWLRARARSGVAAQDRVGWPYALLTLSSPVASEGTSDCPHNWL